DVKKKDEDLEAWRSGKKRPDWMNATVNLLLPQLTAATADERLAAALALIGLAKEEQGLPVLLEIAKKGPQLQGKAAEALSWLPWPKRLDVFHQLLALKPQAEQLADIIGDMAASNDQRNLEPFWALTRDDHLPIEAANRLLTAFNQLYFGQ